MDSNNEYSSDNISCTSPYIGSYVDPDVNPYCNSYGDSYDDSYDDPYTNLYNNPYTNSDAELQENDNKPDNTAARRKTIDETAEEKSVKKIRVNITDPIIVLKKGQEEVCGTNYKYNTRTRNMKLHLRAKHGILGSNDLKQDTDKKHQLHIDKMVRKVTPHKEIIQAELRRVT
ncbi:1557_t:CDS:2, partial [Cetraspora pellucida]